MALPEGNMFVLIFFLASPLPAFSLVASDNVCDGGSTVYKDCAAIKIGNTGAGTGTYDISVGCSDSSCCLTVYCEMDIMGGGWTVFQRRFDGSVNFFRNWTEYENGFGSVNAEHWLGLKHVQEMANVNTETHDLLLKVHEENYPNCLRYVHYSGFYLEDSSDNYRLRLSSRIATNLNMWSTGHDMMTVEKDQQFSTFEVDNDPYLPSSCAQTYYGGWWFGACHSNLMNGIYSPGCTHASASITLWEASEHRFGFAGSMLGIRPTAYASAQPATNLCTQTDSQSCTAGVTYTFNLCGSYQEWEAWSSCGDCTGNRTRSRYRNWKIEVDTGSSNCADGSSQDPETGIDSCCKTCGDFHVVSNREVGSNPLNTISSISTSFACGRICLQTADCFVFHFDSSGNTCVLGSASSTITSSTNANIEFFQLTT